MSKLAELVSLVNKGEVSIFINEHRTCYQSISRYIEDRIEMEDIDKDVRLGMLERNTVVQINFYPSTPIGSHIIYHYDIDLAIERALEIMREKV